MDQQEHKIDRDFRIDYNALAPFVLFTMFLYSQGDADPKVARAALLATLCAMALMVLRYFFARRSRGRTIDAA